MSDATLSIDMPQALKAELEKYASLEQVDPSILAKRAIGAYLAAQNAKYAAIDEALVEADKGIFVSGEAVLRWVESWGTENELPPPEPDVFLK